jgi:hypothetical protein
MRQRPIALVVLALAAAGGAAAPGSPVNHSELGRLRAPLELARACFPRDYRAEVALSGDIADEMRASIAKLGLDAPRFVETMSSAGGGHLDLANPGYSLETRELLSGILNPLEMIDIVVNSLVKYRDEKKFADLVRQTSVTRGPAPNGLPVSVCTYTLSPRAERFGYQYEDAGAQVGESWLERLCLVVDTTRQLVQEITLLKRSRAFSMDQTERPPAESTTAHYAFSYDSGTGCLLPALLMLYTNDTLALTIGASYRTEGQHVVFDSRTICFGPGGQNHSCLSMHYSGYTFEQAPRGPHAAPRPDKRTREVQKAAEFSRQASEELRAGSIAASLRTLRKLVSRYPGTPQAIEARKVLECVPNGL